MVDGEKLERSQPEGSTEKSPAAPRFAISFDRPPGLITSLFLPPAAAYIEIAQGEVRCQMGWAFRARFPQSAVRSAERFTKQVRSSGIHGFGGRWLVNGARSPILALELQPTQRARILGFPVRLKELLLSVSDPEEVARYLRSS